MQRSDIKDQTMGEGLIQGAMNQIDLRPDGTPKGNGWLGVLPVTYPDGKTGVATEYSVGVKIGGKDVIIPTLIPTLTPEEQKLMLESVIPQKGKVPQAILMKAVEFAAERLRQGLSPFKE